MYVFCAESKNGLTQLHTLLFIKSAMICNLGWSCFFLLLTYLSHLMPLFAGFMVIFACLMTIVTDLLTACAVFMVVFGCLVTFFIELKTIYAGMITIFATFSNSLPVN